MTRQNRNVRFYVHNLSNFDYIFIADVLSTLGAKMDIRTREKKIMKIQLTFTNNSSEYKFYIYDSYLLLPSSLKDLSKHFNIEQKKILFPVLFPNKEDYDINYKGPVPALEFFPKNTTIEEYNKYCDNYKNSD